MSTFWSLKCKCILQVDKNARISTKQTNSKTKAYNAINKEDTEMVYNIDYQGVKTHPSPTPKHPWKFIGCATIVPIDSFYNMNSTYLPLSSFSLCFVFLSGSLSLDKTRSTRELKAIQFIHIYETNCIRKFTNFSPNSILCNHQLQKMKKETQFVLAVALRNQLRD